MIRKMPAPDWTGVEIGFPKKILLKPEALGRSVVAGLAGNRW